jgi:hypothetical protein
VADDVAIDPEAPSAEEKQLWQWRYLAALANGLADPDACLYADAGLDSHALADLRGKGCDAATALRILLR